MTPEKQIFIKSIVSFVIFLIFLVTFIVKSTKKHNEECKKYWKEVEEVTNSWIKDILEHLDKRTTIKIKDGVLHINNFKSSKRDKISMTHFLSGIYVGIISAERIGRKK